MFLENFQEIPSFLEVKLLKLIDRRLNRGKKLKIFKENSISHISKLNVLVPIYRWLKM